MCLSAKTNSYKYRKLPKMEFKIITKLALVFLLVTGLNLNYASAQDADPNVSGAVFDPDEIDLGSTSELQITFSNAGFDPIPAGSIELTIDTPEDFYVFDGVTAPAGTGGALFSWVFVDGDFWRGTNIGEIAPFGGGMITVDVEGIMESTTFEITNINVQPVNSFGSFDDAPGNNNLQPGLKVNSSCPDPLDSDMDGLTDCEELDGVDDPTTDAAPDGTSDPMNPCDPDPTAVADGDCDMDGNPNGTDPNVDMVVAENDAFEAVSTIPTLYNILVNDDFLPGSSITVTTVTGANTDAAGTITYDPIAGTIEYTALESEEGTDVSVEYEVCNTAVDPAVCTTAIITITVTDGCPNALDTDMDGLTDCEEENGVDDPTTDAMPDGTSNPMDPCDPDPAAVADGDCDMDGTPNGDDPNPDTPVAMNDEFIAMVGSPITFNILANDDFLPGQLISIMNVGPTPPGAVAFDAMAGTITYTPVMAEVGTTTEIEYEVCFDGGECATAMIMITVMDQLSIGEYVWEDVNADGIQDADEEGIEGVTVNLYLVDGEIPSLVGTELTDEDGAYLFDGLSMGDYYVEFVAPTDEAYSPTFGNTTTDDLDSDVDDSNGAGTTATFTLDGNNLDVAAGFVICEGISCSGSLNVSIDQSCMTVLTPSMFLTDASFPDAAYEIVIVNSEGDTLPNLLTGEDVGNSYTVSIISPLCGDNSCWMTVNVEDYLAPTISCEDVTVSCNGVGNVPLPVLGADCGNTEIVLINEINTNIDCDDDFIGMIERTYIGVDSGGNESEPCTQTIMLERVTVGTIVPPAAYLSPSNNLSCGSGFATDANGNPAVSVTGVPTTVDGTPLFPFDNSIFCSGFSEYDDVVLSDDGCIKKIMRQFTIGEWHCNSTNEVVIFQMIDVVDDQDPTITAPADMTVSTATFSCEASVEFPAATVADVCNDVTVDIAYPDGFIDDNNGGLAILPVGEHLVTYTAYDACLNSASATMTVTVVDNADPIALCDGFDVVSIGTGNSASLTAVALDDGSFDECGAVTLSVARMDDPGFDDGSAFAPAAEFTCSDIGQQIMLALLVTDMGGNTNMCMVQVEVQDKIDAFISCPADITVDCTTPYDLDNLDSFGVPTITDNCTTTPYEETVTSDFNQCGVGEIVRTFTVLDNGARTCTQVITFENQNATFTESDIDWPDDYIVANGCTEGDLSPSGLDAIDADFGFPVVTDMSTCILTGENFTDQEFEGGGGACRTIYRTWKVIDWCAEQPNGSFPTYEHVQTIEVNNITAPTFTSGTETITVESFAADCQAPVPVEGLLARATDDCTTDENLVFSYIIDLDNDGSNDIAGEGTLADGTYPLGTHLVRFTVADGCGNVAFQERLFTIVNLKTATPYCLDNISVNLTPWDTDGDGTPDTEKATITPDMIDGGSFHSCGYDIQLSFSADVNDTELIVDCDDIGLVEVQLWVTDENGNADFCVTDIEVQDNNDVNICGAQMLMATVSGMIYTEDSEEVESVQVGLMSADVLYDNTNETGEYAFPDMPTGGEYMVLPAKNDDHSNGVSTLDLVLIQRHILGLGDLDSPYKMIAADINSNESISAADVVILRKVILGVYDEFPSNTSWRFVDAEFSFHDATDPWLGNIPEDYEITSLTSDMNVDFVGVKTGDVNGSVTANAQSVSTETRSNNTWTLTIEDRDVRVGEIISVEVKSSDITKVYGWQYSLEASDLSLIDVSGAKANVSTQHIYDDRGTIHMSYGEANGLELAAEEVLYTIKMQVQRSGRLSEMLSISDRGIRAESYHAEMDINSIDIRWTETTEEPVMTQEFSVSQNEPNPWYDRTTIDYYIPANGDVRLIVKDVAGRAIFSTSAYREAGNHTQVIDDRILDANGVLIYEVHYDDQIISNRMIHIK